MKQPLKTVLQILVLVGMVALVHLYFFPARGEGEPVTTPPAPGERHLRNLRQLTAGGENAEAYWAFDGKRLIFQSTRDGGKADQIYVMSADGSSPRMVSTGKGRCTCGYFLKGDDRILFASTHLAAAEPPTPPDRSQGYVWGVFPGYDIFSAKPDGSDLRPLTRTPGYDAEATVSPDGKRIVFTSLRDGDLDLYSMKVDGSDVRRLTQTLGYDGGAFYSPDGKQLCYRANHPQGEQEIREYRELLSRNLVKPSRMELFVSDADGSHPVQVTRNGAANFCPFFTPDGKRLIFASNMEDPRGREFDLYLVNLDGSDLERVTTAPEFDGFPMFSPDGKQLVWASNRNAKERGDTNIFVADWVP
jgi:Tol biopolymer transport system component